ncbi:glycosyltransferase [Cobetia sp. 4B]|uniref:glycosyltransferase family 4 protein n=1 Tax=Cobetia sp. 4B TaxID=2758724 RepID=UPI001C057B36|nr:glycosyltransferase [Cobetia sp. 4B]QWN35857.1 glycosyltransferase [Cobetia sp. 4B]
MKIIHILECWGNAGTERYVTNLVNASNKSINHLEFAILGEISHRSSCTFLPGRIKNFCNNKSPVIALIFYILKTKTKDTICHLHLYSSIFPVSLLLKIIGVKFVITYHVPLSQWNVKHRILWIASGYLADKRIAVSSFIREEFKKFFTTRVIFPPVWSKADIPKDQELKPSISSEIQTLKIICVGRLENKQKDWLTLIDAISQLTLASQNIVSVLIIGDGPDKEIIQDYIAKHNLGKVIELKGHLEKDQVFAYLEESSISVLPSKFEGFGMSAVESMSRESLTITSDFPASFDFIQHGVTGYHFKVGDSKGLAVILELVINDDKLRNKVALQGKKFARQEFSDSLCALEYYKLYNSL